MTEDRKGRYALAHPTPGGYAFWAINDTVEKCAIAFVREDVRGAEEAILKLWEQITEER